MTEQGQFLCHICKGCGADSRHEVLYVDEAGGVATINMVKFEEHMLVECRGCLFRSFVKRVAERPRKGRRGRSTEISQEWFPCRSMRKAPNWIVDLDGEIGALYKEINSAFDSGFLRLSAMGARALIEMLMIDKVGDKKSFKANAKAMVDNHVINHQQYEVLESMIEVGHAAMHRGFSPNLKIMIEMFDLLDGLVYMTYVANRKALILRTATPKKNQEGAVA